MLAISRYFSSFCWLATPDDNNYEKKVVTRLYSARFPSRILYIESVLNLLFYETTCFRISIQFLYRVLIYERTFIISASSLNF